MTELAIFTAIGRSTKANSRIPKSAIRNSRSEIRIPKSPIRNPK